MSVAGRTDYETMNQNAMMDYIGWELSPPRFILPVPGIEPRAFWSHARVSNL